MIGCRCLALVLASALAACGSGLPGCEKADQAGTSLQATEESERKLVVGFSQVGAESAWRTAETDSIKSEAAKRGVELKFADAQQRQANQIKAVRSFVAQKLDVIVIAPVVETGWEPVLREARQAGIPVFLVDRGISVSDQSLYVCLIASDFVEEGRMAGEWLAKKTNRAGNVVELEGTTGSAPAIDRKKGFHEALDAYPGMKVIKSQSADFTRAKGKEVMEAFLKSDRERIQAVYAHNDDMALGAVQALEEAGLRPGFDVVLISIDAVRAAFEAMVAGKLNATVECNPLLGPILFDTIEQVRAGKSIPKYIKQIDRLFESDAAAELIDSRQY
ncbi:MAG: ABC transporter substrate-binding protein [bacterium]|nr:ABC transporter substrate-binding protein [bacterium]